jgi:hypothetical protein
MVIHQVMGTAVCGKYRQCLFLSEYADRNDALSNVLLYNTIRWFMGLHEQVMQQVHATLYVGTFR